MTKINSTGDSFDSNSHFDQEFDLRKNTLKRIAEWEVMLDQDLEDCYTVGSRIAKWESMLTALDGSAE